MGKLDLRLTDKAALGLALATLACAAREGSGTGSGTGGEDGTESDTDGGQAQFQLTSARLDATGEQLILSFSAPVGPVDEVSPADFRISYATPEELCGGQGCSDVTTYRDPNFFVDQYYAYSYDGEPGYPTFTLVELLPGQQPDEIVLRAATPLDPRMCDALTYYEANGGDYILGLFVHHSPGEIPLTSTEGEALAPIGAEWVEKPQPVWLGGADYPDLDPLIEIPCEL